MASGVAPGLEASLHHRSAAARRWVSASHAPLVVAEQFRTLAALCPDRLDLGLGRTGCRDGSMPPSVALSMQARGTFDPLGNFDFALEELASYLQGTMAGQEGVEGTTAVDNVPIWILASSMPGVACALYNGLPLAIRPTTSLEDLRLLVRTYKSMFKPSSPEARARAMVNVDCFAAETDEEAHYLSTSMKQMVCNGIRNQQSGLPPQCAMSRQRSLPKRLRLWPREWPSPWWAALSRCAARSTNSSRPPAPTN